MMGRPMIFIVLLALFFVSSVGKSRDLYKVLGVDRNANQRDIQKAFHRLSLQYHPDKNKNKGAQEKFAEINNAYEILSDEEKRKNYDLYGDEKGTPGFDGGGYTYFTGGGGDFTSRRNGWQMGGHQNPHSFSFSFGGNPTGGGGSAFDFGFGDLFSSIFGANSKSESQFGGSRQSLLDVDSQTFTKEIVDQGLTWLLLFYSPKIKGYGTFESVVHDISLSLKGAIKAGRVNCQEEQSLCSNLGIWPSKVVRFFVYSYKTAEKGELVEYGEELDPKKLMAFCHDQLPRFSTRHSSSGIEFFLTSKEKLPQLLLLSAKKETPVIWRVLSGLYRKRFKFHDAQVFDIVDERVKRFKVNALPAIVGRLLNGEEHVLKEGIALKDLNSGIREMKVLLNKFEQLSMKTPHSEAQCDVGLPYLTSSNMETICGESIPLCIIGVFRSTKGKKNMELILSQISQKTLTRRRSQPHASRDSISFCMLDAAKQREFLQSFDDSACRSSDDILLAYKPRKGKFSLLQTSRLTFEEAEGFVGSALNGDITFSKIQRKPILQ